ncbi:MAG: nitroreductase family protein [Candidatus Zixiibacteriota bacterium]|jgi:nitroreductase
MEFYEAVQKRRSIRAYLKKPIPDDIFRRIMDSARLAPSAKNLQPWKFIVIRDDSRKKEIARICKERLWIADASVIIAGVATNPDYRMGSGQPSSQIDIAIALTQIALAAASESLGTCWIGSFDLAAAKKYLAIPEEYILVGFMTLGCPAEVPPPKDRKFLEEILIDEQWHE